MNAYAIFECRLLPGLEGRKEGQNGWVKARLGILGVASGFEKNEPCVTTWS